MVLACRWLRSSSRTFSRSNESSSKTRTSRLTRRNGTRPRRSTSTLLSSARLLPHGCWTSTTRQHWGHSTTVVTMCLTGVCMTSYSPLGVTKGGGGLVGWLFFFLKAATKLARQVQQERTQAVCSNKVGRSRLARRPSRNEPLSFFGYGLLFVIFLCFFHARHVKKIGVPLVEPCG